MKLVLATRNPGKIEEMRSLLAGLDVELVPVETLRDVTDVDETGTTIEANARLKAVTVARASGMSALADDTGLEVDALNGAPGVYAARYAGPTATYADNCRKLLADMADVPPEKRRATFRAVMALAHPDGRVVTVEGTCPGVILERAEGEGGFGYDPVFKPDAADRSFAALPLSDKNRISHRGVACRKARTLVEAWLAEKCACRDSNAGPAD